MAAYSILVVEDEHTLRRLLEYRLSKQYDVRTAANGEEALERINHELGTLTAVITHNATIASMADRVIHLSDGQIAKIDRNTTKASPHELVW